jgi:hypothetical protein
MTRSFSISRNKSLTPGLGEDPGDHFRAGVAAVLHDRGLGRGHLAGGVQGVRVHALALLGNAGSRFGLLLDIGQHRERFVGHERDCERS